MLTSPDISDAAIITGLQAKFGLQGSVQDRQRGLRIIEQFASNNVVDIAHRSFQQLSVWRLTDLS